MAALRIALLTIRLVMRTKAALFFSFVMPIVFLFIYAGLFAHGNPKAVAYLFGPVVTLNIMGSAFWGLGLQSVMQRERGSLRRYRLAPIGAATIIVSNLLANYLLELPTIALLVFFAEVVFHMTLTVGWLTLLILVTIGTFGFAGFGLTIGSVANTMQEAQIYNNLVWLTLLFLSGTTVPLPLLPGWIQSIATFLPATYLVTSFQAIMLQSEAVTRHWPELAALVVSGFFGLLFAWKLFRWEKEEKIPRASKAWALAFVIPFLLIGLWMDVYANPKAAWAASYSLMTRGPQAASTATGAVKIEGFDGADAGNKANYSVLTDDGDGKGGRTTARLVLVSPGAAGTQSALRFEGRLDSALSSAMPRATAALELGRAPKGRDIRGVEFWVRGDGHEFQVAVASPAAATGSAPTGLTFIPSPEWQQVRIPTATPAARSEAEKQKSWRMEMTSTGFRGNFWLEIDEISFY